MRFDYDQYRMINYTIPIMLLAFTIIITIPSAVLAVKAVIRVIFGNMPARELLSPKLLACYVLGMFYFLSLNPLIHGGFYLKDEFETDAIESCGFIEEIKILDGFSGQKYQLKDKTTYGAKITIDGIVYTIMEAGSLHEGEEVGFSFLPKSRFILRIWNRNSEIITPTEGGNITTDKWNSWESLEYRRHY